jgi:hypothetical protein
MNSSDDLIKTVVLGASMGEVYSSEENSRMLLEVIDDPGVVDALDKAGYQYCPHGECGTLRPGTAIRYIRRGDATHTAKTGILVGKDPIKGYITLRNGKKMWRLLTERYVILFKLSSFQQLSRVL